MRRLLAITSVVVATFALAGAVSASELDPGGSFIDDDGSVFEGSIEAISREGITKGCSDRAQYCPERGVTRGEMAAFLDRAVDLPTPSRDFFTDDQASIFQSSINAIAQAQITKGCNPPANTRFCPEGVITRGEMAAFLVRALSLPPAGTPDRFEDDDSSIFESSIDALAEAGITKGCNPPANTEFCPGDAVSRGAMAAFLARALSLEATTPPPRPPTHLVARFTTYHSCCQPRVRNIQVMARQIDDAIILPWETFDLNQFLGPRTTSKGYVPAPILLNGESYCCDHPLNIGGGTSQFGTTFYNTVFWGGYDIVSHRPHSRYIDRYPLGIEATLAWPTPNVVFHNDTWTPVHVRTSYGPTSITVELWGNNGGRTLVGSHANGRTSTRITRSGGDSARVVTARVTGSATYADGGRVTVRRTITGPDGTSTETWHHTYIGE